MRSKLRYLFQELGADLMQGKGSEFWTTIAIFVTCFWLRMYIHYLGQFLYLKGTGIPVFSFEAFVYTMQMKYISTTSDLKKEVIVVALGPMSPLIVFVGMTVGAWSIKRVTKNVPDVLSKFIIAWGLATVFDPLLIFLVDIIVGNYGCSTHPGCEIDYTSSDCNCFTGDAFKLWERLETDENNGITGSFATLILYVAIGILTLFCFYNYLIYVHMNGRMLDVYRRLHGETEDFFVPMDLELSYEQLAYICARSKRWTHPNGSVRKIAVCDYELTDPLDPKFKETTTHLTIFTMEIDGARTLWRHFLKMPSGAIVELFSENGNSSFGGAYQALENLVLSDQNVKGVGGGGAFANFLA